MSEWIDGLEKPAWAAPSNAVAEYAQRQRELLEAAKQRTTIFEYDPNTMVVRDVSDSSAHEVARQQEAALTRAAITATTQRLDSLDQDIMKLWRSLTDVWDMLGRINDRLSALTKPAEPPKPELPASSYAAMKRGTYGPR